MIIITIAVIIIINVISDNIIIIKILIIILIVVIMIIMVNIVTAIYDENKNTNICILKLQSHRQDLYSSPSEIRPVAEGYSLLSLNLPPCFWVLVLQKEPTLQDVSGFDAELYQVSAANI